MNTRTTTAADDDAHLAALAKAIAQHPCVGVELKAMRKEIDAAKRKAAATQEVLDDLMKSFGTRPATASAAAPHGPTDAEVLAKFDAMTPAEKAAVMLKAAPTRRFTMQGDGPVIAGNIFGR